MDSCGLRVKLAKRFNWLKMKTENVKRRTRNFAFQTNHEELDEMEIQIRNVTKKTPKKLIFLSRSMRFLIILQVASFAMTFDKVIGLFASQNNRFWCVIQALCLNIFGLEMHIWSLVISVYLFYSSMILPKNLRLHKRSNIAFEVLAHLVAHTLTAILVALPYPFGVIGPSASGWCWIDPSTHAGRVFIYVSFYLPVWIIMIVTSIVYNIVLIAVFRTLKNTTTITSYLKNEKHLKLTLKLLLYPGISLVVWIIPTVNRLLNTFGYSSVPLGAMHIYCISLNGFLNVLVFFLNPLKHIKILFMIFCFPLYIVKKRKQKASSDTPSVTSSGRQRRESVLDTVAFLARSAEEEYEDIDELSEDSTDSREVPLMEQEIPSGVRVDADDGHDSDDSIYMDANTEQSMF